MIEARGLTKRFGDTVAVDDLTFEVRPGVVTGFLGPNGAGKSTTMRMILGLDRPTSGRALISGREYRMFEQPLRNVGAVLESDAFHPARSARGHLRVAARSNGIPVTRIDEVLEQSASLAASRHPMTRPSRRCMNAKKQHAPPHGSHTSHRRSIDTMNCTAHRLALGIAAGAALFLLFGIGALGVVGAEGDRADTMFLGVLAIGLAGAVVTRLRPEGMVWTMVAMATATMIVGLIAILLGKHNVDESSVAEILGLTGMFASMFAASAWRFRVAAQQRRPATHLHGTIS